MTDTPQDTQWPRPSLRFQVSVDGMDGAMAFSEVTGLDDQTRMIEYRAGGATPFDTIRMPGVAQNGTATFKRGLVSKGADIAGWFGDIKMNTITRRDVTITLMDVAGQATMSWTLSNAFPTKMTGMDGPTDGAEWAIETLELAHEGLRVTNP